MEVEVELQSISYRFGNSFFKLEEKKEKVEAEIFRILRLKAEVGAA